MNWFVYFLVCGGAFFTGAAVLLVAALLRHRVSSSLRPVVRWVALLAGITIAISGTPLPAWFYALWASAFFVWFVQPRGQTAAARLARSRNLALAGITALAIVLELVWQYPSPPPHLSASALYVIGDSISAGIGEHAGSTWPAQLARAHDIRVINLSTPGATAATAMTRLADVQESDAVILIEIGGNDVLNRTPVAEFEQAMSGLVNGVRGGSRLVFLVEVPVPPLHNAYGRVFRRMARPPDVILVPRRIFMRPIVGAEATLDGLHLSQRGHAAMAASMWKVVRAVFTKSRGRAAHA